MFLLREAYPEDLGGIHAVARHLNTVNLPDDRATLEGLVALSQRSFAGELAPMQREYLFVLVDTDHEDRVVGTSMVHAQHGTRRSPHIYFEVMEEERYSETLDRYFVHRVLRIGYNYNGPTEIGGLIVLPEYRDRPEKLGKLLSYVRFLYVAMHRDRFRDEVLSELLPPLGADGTSLLWEALGRHFTGLDYQEADRISKHNKEFIRTLFPQEAIYVCLLPAEVQALIGQVGPETKGVEKMLRRIGFKYAERIDPFDGGPHFTALTDQVTLVRATRSARLAAGDEPPVAGPETALVGFERPERPRFAALASPYRLGADDELALPAAARQALGLRAGDPVAVLPLG